MSVTAAGEWLLSDRDGEIFITMNGATVFYADNYAEAELFITFVEGLPRILGLADIMSKVLMRRREHRGELAGAVEIHELERAPEGDAGGKYFYPDALDAVRRDGEPVDLEAAQFDGWEPPAGG